MKFSKLDAVVSGLYNEIVSNGLTSNRELIVIQVSRDNFESEYSAQAEYIRDRLTKLFAISNNKITMAFKANMLNYDSFKYCNDLQVTVSYTIK